MTRFEYEILSPDIVYKRYQAAQEWLRDPDAVITQVSPDGSHLYPSAQERIAEEGGREVVGPLFIRELKSARYSQFTLFLATGHEMTLAAVRSGGVLVGAVDTRRTPWLIETTVERLERRGLLEPAGDIVVLAKDVRIPQTQEILISQQRSFQTTPKGVRRLQQHMNKQADGRGLH